ncbi:hypothetical protein C5167_035035 [Papaver somniferum]|uniref:Uncharacterized protein n=1 Tax=Papaver somniferum TaxID=3469 RepID=A0A4Y7KGD8_PAPSO|nr:hypothetical protein C5167_035035 [Papaver somniferum]
MRCFSSGDIFIHNANILTYYKPYTSQGTEATISDKNVSITPAIVIAPTIVPLKREHRLTIAEINSATRASTSERNASFTVLAQILSLNDKWLIIYCPICFGHMSDWKHNSIFERQMVNHLLPNMLWAYVGMETS